MRLIQQPSAAELERQSRAGIMLSGQGLISQNYDRLAALGSGGFVAVGGTIYGVAIPLLAGDVVSNLSVMVTTAGSGVTASLLGLYDTAGTRLAVSADQGTAWQSTGLKTVAMTTPYAVPATGLYYGAIIATASTTVPAFHRAATNASIAINVAVGSGINPIVFMTGQTELVASATFSAGVGGVCYWVGVS